MIKATSVYPGYVTHQGQSTQTPYYPQPNSATLGRMNQARTDQWPFLNDPAQRCNPITYPLSNPYVPQTSPFDSLKSISEEDQNPYFTQFSNIS